MNISGRSLVFQIHVCAAALEAKVWIYASAEMKVRERASGPVHHEKKVEVDKKTQIVVRAPPW